MPKKKRDLRDRFWPKVNISQDPYDCWEWIGAIDPQTGYGRIGLGGRKDGVGNAHRVSFQLTYGFIGSGKEICHSCSNRTCVNPLHLYEGTKSDNMKQAWKEGTGNVPSRWIPGALFTINGRIR